MFDTTGNITEANNLQLEAVVRKIGHGTDDSVKVDTASYPLVIGNADGHLQEDRHRNTPRRLTVDITAPGRLHILKTAWIVRRQTSFPTKNGSMTAHSARPH